MTDGKVFIAAAQYQAGHSLAALSKRYGVGARTISKELKKIGVVIRPPR